jgi:nucleoside-diphosphate-sugar epimerase
LTGANGYIGCELRKNLEAPVICLDQAGPADIQTCISNLSAHRARLREVTHVIHLADARLDQYTSENFDAHFAKHRLFVEELQYLPNLRGIVFSSSCSVYGYTDQKINENSEVSPTSWYAESKIKLENLLREQDVPVSILRFGTAFGRSGNMRWDLLPNQIVRTLAFDSEIELFDLDSIRPYIHVDDFAQALIHGLSFSQSFVCNVVESNLSKRELVEKLPHAHAKLKINESRKDIRNYSVDTQTSRERGFEFSRSMAEGLAEIYMKVLKEARDARETRAEALA